MVSMANTCDYLIVKLRFIWQIPHQKTALRPFYHKKNKKQAQNHFEIKKRRPRGSGFTVANYILT